MTANPIPRKIIICSTQRSGSTFFCEVLKEAGWGNPSELYLPLIRKLRSGNQHDYAKSISALEQKSVNRNISSVKIMANYLPHIEMILQKKDTETSEDIPTPESAKDFESVLKYYDGAIWLWLRRENTIKQAMSRIVARKTKIYHSTDINDKNSPNNGENEINIKSKVLDKEIFKISCENSIWQEFFETNSLDYTMVSYEELVKNRTSLVEYLSKKYSLQITPSDTAVNKLKKLSNVRTKDQYNLHLKRLMESVSVRYTR